jgi:hypothetical protein
MGYRNKTYVIFDADEDMWAYRSMLGWKSRDHLDLDFHDVHDLNAISDRAKTPSAKTEGALYKCEASRRDCWQEDQEPLLIRQGNSVANSALGTHC